VARPSTAWGSLPFAEQIAFFRDKLDLPTKTWQDLLGAAHDRAFVVAGAMRADLLADLHAATLKGIEKGTSLSEFRRDFEAIVAKRGWTGWTGEDTPGGRAWRTNLIYGTNMRTSYQAGRHAQALDIAHRRPYWRWRHADTVAHPRPLHVAWDGKILRYDNPWWQAHWPPAGWLCRCRVETLSQSDLERLGKSGPDPTPDDGTYEWLDKAGNSHTIPNGIDPGWDYTPGSTRDLIAEVKAKAAGLPEALGKALVEEVTATAERVADAFSLGVRDGSLYQNRTIRHGDDAARLAMQAHLGDVEAAALADYLGEGYKSVNRALNGLTPMTRMQADIFEGYQSALNQALDHLDRQPHAVLKRVMGGNQDEVNRFIDQLKAGMKTKSREVRIDSYMSTSGPTGTYTPGSVKARITIRAKPGSDQAGYVDGLSDFPAEDEVLYKAGSRFRVLKIAGGRGKPWEIELEEL